MGNKELILKFLINDFCVLGLNFILRKIKWLPIKVMRYDTDKDTQIKRNTLKTLVKSWQEAVTILKKQNLCFSPQSWNWQPLALFWSRRRVQAYPSPSSPDPVFHQTPARAGGQRQGHWLETMRLLTAGEEPGSDDSV